MEVALNRGFIALIDGEDWPLVSQRAWCRVRSKQADDRYYARCWVLNGNTYLHRVILAAKPGDIIDHINGDGLDNRRANLRFVSRAQNNANRRGYSPASGFRGVYAAGRRWQAQITVDGKNIRLGCFADRADAARAYDAAALSAFGEAATLNFTGRA